MEDRMYTKYLWAAGAILAVVGIGLFALLWRTAKQRGTPIREPARKPIMQEQALKALPPAPPPEKEAEVREQQSELLKTLPPPPKTSSPDADAEIKKQQEELLRLLPQPPE